MSFDPQAGREHAGRRPGLVLSPRAYNARVGLALLCPVTSQIKGYPFEVALPDGLRVGGVVLSDQVGSLDWRARKAEFIDRAPRSVTQEVLLNAGSLLRPDALT